MRRQSRRQQRLSSSAVRSGSGNEPCGCSRQPTSSLLSLLPWFSIAAAAAPLQIEQSSFQRIAVSASVVKDEGR